MPNNFLSDQAIRELRQLYKDVTQIKNRLKRTGGTGPRVQQQTYAEIISFDTTNLGYNATEVMFNGDGPSDWIPTASAREWGDGTDKLGVLYAIDSTESNYTGVHPVFRFSDGTQAYWGFIPQGTGGFDPFYFDCSINDSTSVRVSNNRYQYVNNMGTIVDSDIDVNTISDGTYYVYFEALRDYTGWSFGIEATTDGSSHPDQTMDGTSYAIRKELCEVLTNDSEILTVNQIWPGNVLDLDQYFIEDTISGMIEAPTSKSYTLDQFMCCPGAVTNITCKSAVGDCNAQLLIDGTSVNFAGVGQTFTFNTSQSSFDATSDNTFDEGNTMSLLLSDATSISDAAFSIRFLRVVE